MLLIKKVEIPALDENIEVFVMHMTFLSLNSIPMHIAQKAQIALLVAKQVKILTKYSDFADVFSKKKALILPKITKLNQHAIELQKSQQPFYWSIYNLGPVELKRLKTYIKTNLTNSFIQPLKPPTDALILFIRKSDGSLCLCIDY